MAATVHNSSALSALVEQPGSSFTQSRAGFDTGRRTFKCWQASVMSLIPKRGDSDETFTGMKVDTVNIGYDRAGLAMVDVSYLGTLVEDDIKPDEWTYTVNYSPDAGGTVTYNGTVIDLSTYHPQVTRVYLTDELPAGTVGDFSDPDKFADLVPSEVVQYPTINKTLTFTVSYKGWRLTGRTIRENGERYEVTDTYNYEFVIASSTLS